MLSGNEFMSSTEVLLMNNVAFYDAGGAQCYESYLNGNVINQRMSLCSPCIVMRMTIIFNFQICLKAIFFIRLSLKEKKILGKQELFLVCV